MPAFTVKEIADALGATFAGDGGLTVIRLEEPARARANELAVAMDPRFLEGIRSGQARAAILPDGTDWQDLGLKAAIFVQRPRLAMAGLTKKFLRPANDFDAVAHPTAVVDETALIGLGTRIGPNAVVENHVEIGEQCHIGPNVWIGEGVRIGPRAWIGAGTAIWPGVTIGAGFVAHTNVSLGGDGFSFVTPEKSAVEEVRETLGDSRDATEQAWIKIHSLGGVEIGDDVEVGSNSSVDAGTIRPTSIGSGSKLDALVQVGHNARIGRNVLLCAHVAVGGSAIVGDNSVLGGQVGVADNITLGAGVIAGGATKILSNVPQGRALLGYPAMKMETHVETYKALRRLPRLMARVAGLEKAVGTSDKNK